MTAREKALAEAVKHMVRWFDRYWSQHLGEHDDRSHWSEELRGMVDAKEALAAALALPEEACTPGLVEAAWKVLHSWASGHDGEPLADAMEVLDSVLTAIPAAVPPTPDASSTPDGAAVGCITPLEKQLTEALAYARLERGVSPIADEDQRAEVERLEAKRLDDHAKLYAAIGDRDAARKECERLTRERDEVRAVADAGAQVCANALCEIRKLMSGNERLRAALSEAANDLDALADDERLLSRITRYRALATGEGER